MVPTLALFDTAPPLPGPPPASTPQCKLKRPFKPADLAAFTRHVAAQHSMEAHALAAKLHAAIGQPATDAEALIARGMDLLTRATAAAFDILPTHTPPRTTRARPPGDARTFLPRALAQQFQARITAVAALRALHRHGTELFHTDPQARTLFRDLTAHPRYAHAASTVPDFPLLRPPANTPGPASRAAVASYLATLHQHRAASSAAATALARDQHMRDDLNARRAAQAAYARAPRASHQAILGQTNTLALSPASSPLPRPLPTSNALPTL